MNMLFIGVLNSVKTRTTTTRTINDYLPKEYLSTLFNKKKQLKYFRINFVRELR